MNKTARWTILHLTLIVLTVFAMPENSTHGQTTTPPAPIERPLTGSCSVNAMASSNAGGSQYLVNWNVNVMGGPVSATSTAYTWSGNASSTNPNSRSVQITTNTPGTKSASVVVQRGDETLDLDCSVDLPTISSASLPLGGSCNSSATNLTVNWIGSGSGGVVPYSYTWSGTDIGNATSTNFSVTQTYSSPGSKTATVVIRSADGQQISFTCESEIAENSSGGGGCFIATASYGTDDEPKLEILRDFRDEHLLTNKVGTEFVQTYYKLSPPVADYIRDKEWMRTAVRTGLDPIVWTIDKLD